MIEKTYALRPNTKAAISSTLAQGPVFYASTTTHLTREDTQEKFEYLNICRLLEIFKKHIVKKLLLNYVLQVPSMSLTTKGCSSSRVFLGSNSNSLVLKFK